MVLGMLFENFKNYYILRYVIYEFLKKVLGVPQPTCLVRVFCAGVEGVGGSRQVVASGPGPKQYSVPSTSSTLEVRLLKCISCYI